MDLHLINYRYDAIEPLNVYLSVLWEWEVGIPALKGVGRRLGARNSARARKSCLKITFHVLSY